MLSDARTGQNAVNKVGKLRKSRARGIKCAVVAAEPKMWCESTGSTNRVRAVRFSSLEAGAKLLSAKNRILLRVIAEQRPRSVSELAALTGRAEQNVSR